MIRRPSAASKLSGGRGSSLSIPSAKPQSGGLARHGMQDLAEIAAVEMLNLKKGGVLAPRLVDAETFRDTERRGAFERPEQAGAGHREIRFRCPAFELRRAQKEAPGMRVIDPLKHNPLSERLG